MGSSQSTWNRHSSMFGPFPSGPSGTLLSATKKFGEPDGGRKGPSRSLGKRAPVSSIDQSVARTKELKTHFVGIAAPKHSVTVVGAQPRAGERPAGPSKEHVVGGVVAIRPNREFWIVIECGDVVLHEGTVGIAVVAAQGIGRAGDRDAFVKRWNQSTGVR